MMNGKITYQTLCNSGFEELERFMVGGFMPAMEDLEGWEFRGYNVHPFTRLLGIRKFKKGFVRDPGNPHSLQGYNVKVKQNSLLDPWLDIIRKGEPIHHGFFKVSPVDPAQRDNVYPRSLLLDYGAGRNPMLDPSKLLRDYLVQVMAGDRDLYLGRATLALSIERVPVGFFVLERHTRIL